jgi:uncharacterized membrane protein (UPF0182 family)
MDTNPPPQRNPWKAAVPPTRPSSSFRTLRLITRLVIPGMILRAIAIGMITGYLEKWLWMGQLTYANIFWTLFSVQWTMFAVSFVAVFLFVWLNFRHALVVGGVPAGRGPMRRLLVPTSRDTDSPELELTPHLLHSAIVIGSLLIAWLAAFTFFGQWDTWLRFRYGASFGVADPLYGKDVGFYVFQLPFYQMLQTSVVLVSIMTMAGTSLVYIFFKSVGLRQGTSTGMERGAMSHLSFLLAILFANWGFGLLLDHYQLVYSTMGVVYGAGYTADHLTRPILWGMLLLSLVACAVFVFNVFRPRLLSMFAAGAGFVGIHVLMVSIVPNLFQKFIVQPSELAFETPYLKHYIDYTRRAYDLTTVQETSYPALADLTPAVIARNQDTIENIRLWDVRPLLQMFQQTQAIRLYYQFYNVAVDRYHLADGYHQVMLATRELSRELPTAAQTWVNETLEFTHGYGLVMNLVSKAIGGGFPQYLVENVPATSTDGIAISQPAIYYGETMPGYRIVNSGTKEFDYPKGNDNVYTSYAGSGGIPLDSLWRRALFAWTQGDINILLTAYIEP